MYYRTLYFLTSKIVNSFFKNIDDFFLANIILLFEISLGKMPEHWFSNWKSPVDHKRAVEQQSQNVQQKLSRNAFVHLPCNQLMHLGM